MRIYTAVNQIIQVNHPTWITLINTFIDIKNRKQIEIK